MKKYLIENLIMLSFLSIALVEIVAINSFIAEIILIPPIIFVVVVLHWRTLVFPLDLIMGPKTREMYYSGLFGTDALEFFPRKLIREFKFYFGKDELLVLLSLDETVLKEYDFQHGDLVIITYYRFSRILKSIKLADRTRKTR